MSLHLGSHRTVNGQQVVQICDELRKLEGKRSPAKNQHGVLKRPVSIEDGASRNVQFGDWMIISFVFLIFYIK